MTTSTLDQNQEDLNQQANEMDRLAALLAEKERVIDSLKATKCLIKELNDIRESKTTYKYKPLVQIDHRLYLLNFGG